MRGNEKKGGSEKTSIWRFVAITRVGPQRREVPATSAYKDPRVYLQKEAVEEAGRHGGGANRPLRTVAQRRKPFEGSLPLIKKKGRW